MSIRTRYEDAHLLFQEQRFDGALLSILVAIAASSRRRYSNKKIKSDRKAFTQFLIDEMPVLTLGMCEESIFLAVKDANPKYYPDGYMQLQDVFYEFVRCSLAHEGLISSKVKFIESEQNTLVQAVTEEGLELSKSYFIGMSRVVEFAPENSDFFPEVEQLPDDVLGWFMFGVQRDSYSEYLKRRSQRKTIQNN